MPGQFWQSCNLADTLTNSSHCGKSYGLWDPKCRIDPSTNLPNFFSSSQSSDWLQVTTSTEERKPQLHIFFPYFSITPLLFRNKLTATLAFTSHLQMTLPI